MGIVLIKKSGEVLANCVKVAKDNKVDLKTVVMTDKKELSKDLRAVRKALEYHAQHLYIVTVDKDGKERKVSATGNYTDNAVFLNIDGNSYVAIVNDTNNGCYVRSYTRCSEKSAQYYWRGERTAKCQNINKEDAENLICGMKFDALIAKVKECKGFKAATSKRHLEVEQLAMSKARTTAKSKAKAEARAEAKSEERIAG